MWPGLSLEKNFGMLKLIRFSMLVAAPPIYLLIASVIRVEGATARVTDLFLLYLLLVISIVQPAIGFLIARYKLSGMRRELLTAASGSALFMSISLVKMALVEAIYVYSFIVFLLSEDIVNMLYFYPVGVVWSVVLWPRKKVHDEFIRQFEGT